MAFSKRSGVKVTPDLSAVEKPEEVARELLLRELTKGPRSAAQLERLLLKHLCPTELSTELLAKYREVGLIDDQAFAKALVNTRRNLKKQAKPMIQRELIAAGVAETDFEAVIDAISRDDELELAVELAIKKLRTCQNLEYAAQYRRTSGYLARRGFNSSLIAEAFKIAQQQVN